jgi:hypothetical protein
MDKKTVLSMFLLALGAYYYLSKDDQEGIAPLPPGAPPPGAPPPGAPPGPPPIPTGALSLDPGFFQAFSTRDPSELVSREQLLRSQQTLAERRGPIAWGHEYYTKPNLVALGISKKEVALFNLLHKATQLKDEYNIAKCKEEYGYVIDSQFESDFINSRLDMMVMKGWLLAYIQMCQEAKLYEGKASTVAGEAISAVVTTGVGMLTAGPLGVVLGMITTFAKTLGAVFGYIAKMDDWKERSKTANHQIFKQLGPPPAILDLYLRHWYAWASSKGRPGQLNNPDQLDEAEVIPLNYFDTYASIPYGCLGLFMKLVKQKRIMYPPLSKDMLGLIQQHWSLNGIQKLSEEYMVKGPPWAFGRSPEAARNHPLREDFRTLLTQYRRGTRSDRFFDIGREPRSSEWTHKMESNMNRFIALYDTLGPKKC